MGMEWLAMIIPVLGIIFLYTWYRKETVWWETLIPLGVVAIFIMIFKFSAEHFMTSTDEYWGGHITKTEYFEPWNEYIHRTCTRTVSCGKDCTTTETYDCSYVRHHSAKWIMYDNNGFQHSISKSHYNYLVRKFGGQKHFVDMRRNYHSRDGDMYRTYWPKDTLNAEIITVVENYENRVKVSNSVFNFQDVSEEDIKSYELYDYPEVKNLKQKNLLGLENPKIERKLELLNGFLGKKKQVKVFLMIFNNQPLKAGELQEAYLKGGNKNEFILCIGKDSLNPKASWVYPISWNTHKILNINVRDYVLKQDTLNLEETVDHLYSEVDKNFVRKHFSKFSYLKVELTTGQLIAVWIVSFVITIGLCVWVILNPYTDSSNGNLNGMSKYNYCNRR